MSARVRHKLNLVAITALLNSPSGPVAKDLIKRGIKVQTRAKRNLGGGTGSGPKRVDTGLLRASIGTNLYTSTSGLTMRIGTGVNYALYVHEGTGIYGPKMRPIRPKNGKVLVFKSKVYGAKKGKYAGKVVVKSVKGMKPNPFLVNALPAAKLGTASG